MQAARGVLLAALLAVAGACSGHDAAPAVGGAAPADSGGAVSPEPESVPSPDGASPPAGSAAPSRSAAGTPPPAVSRPADSPDGARPNGVVPAPEFPVPGPPAVPDELSSPEHRRYQQLRVETLRLMIEAARRALPIAPFQQRIDAAARTALQDVSEAADRMEEIAADLRAALAAADPAGR